MKERKLNYRFHNPNSAAATADYLLKILIRSNAGKVENAIQKAACQEERESLTGSIWRENMALIHVCKK